MHLVVILWGLLWLAHIAEDAHRVIVIDHLVLRTRGGKFTVFLENIFCRGRRLYLTTILFAILLGLKRAGFPTDGA